MSNLVSKNIFVLDTNILINFAIWIPVALNSFFWTKLGDSLKNGDWILLDDVVNEIRSLPDLRSWCQTQRHNGFIKSISNNNRTRAVGINNLYQMINATTLKSTVDTYLVAYAEEHRLTIFSREKPRRDPKDLYKIPDVCSVLKINRISKPEVFMKSIGFKN